MVLFHLKSHFGVKKKINLKSHFINKEWLIIYLNDMTLYKPLILWKTKPLPVCP